MNFVDVPSTFRAYKYIEVAAPDPTCWTVDGQDFCRDPADREDRMVARVEADPAGFNPSG